MGCRFCASTTWTAWSEIWLASEMLDEDLPRSSGISGERVSNVVVMGTGRTAGQLRQPSDLYPHADGRAWLSYQPEERDGLHLRDCAADSPAGRREASDYSGPLPPRFQSEEAPGIDAHRPHLRHFPGAWMPAPSIFRRPAAGLRSSTVWWSGVNDRAGAGAWSWPRLLAGMHGHVNLIPVNPIKERGLCPASRPASVHSVFKNILEKNGINVTIRREMGRDINGACGQLAKKLYGEEQSERKKYEGVYAITDVGAEPVHESGFCVRLRRHRWVIFRTSLWLQTVWAATEPVTTASRDDGRRRWLRACWQEPRRRIPSRSSVLQWRTANRPGIREIPRQDENLAGMGTTVVVAAHRRPLSLCGQCGRQPSLSDPRRTSVRSPRIIPWWRRWYEAASLGKRKRRKHPNKNVITRAVGVEREVNIDFFDLSGTERR